MKKVINIILAASLMAIVAGCGNNPKGGKTTEAGSEAEVQADSLVQAQKTMKTMEKIAAMPEEPVFDIVTSLGTIKVRLYADTPKHRENFAKLAFDGYFDGLQFHRIIKNFMIQGGDPEGTGRGGPGYAIKGEFSQNGFEGNTLSHTLGTVSMARQSMPLDSAGSQFFIVTNETEGTAPTYLDGAYAAFGRVVYGMDTAMEISRVSTNSSDRPLTDQVIKSIRVDTKGVEYKAEKIDK